MNLDNVDYTWDIDYLRKENIGNFKDVVVEVGWRLVALDNENGKETLLGSSIQLPAPIDSSSFIPFKDLKFENVKVWIDSVLDLEAVFNQIKMQIEYNRNVVDQNNLPWNLSQN